MTSVEHPEPIVRTIFKALLSKLLHWYGENRQATNDLLVLSVLSTLTYLFIRSNDLMEQFYEYTRQHEELQLDELALTMGVISSLYISVFAVRRWAEAARRLKQANTDNLTELFNRHKGWEILEHELARAKRYQRPLSLIMLDIDFFKEINDRHGHLAGDYILKAVADIARETVRSFDNLIRWGGEEFIVLLPDTELEAALQVAERLREEISSAPIQVPGSALNITASFGIATKDENTTDSEILVARADQAMYIAKHRGRNRVAISR